MIRWPLGSDRDLDMSVVSGLYAALVNRCSFIPHWSGDLRIIMLYTDQSDSDLRKTPDHMAVRRTLGDGGSNSPRDGQSFMIICDHLSS